MNSATSFARPGYTLVVEDRLLRRSEKGKVIREGLAKFITLLNIDSSILLIIHAMHWGIIGKT